MARTFLSVGHAIAVTAVTVTADEKEDALNRLAALVEMIQHTVGQRSAATDAALK